MNKIAVAKWVNILLYCWVGQAIIKGLFEVWTVPYCEQMQNEIKIPYIVMFSAALTYSTVCITGLLLKKGWGRIISLWWNFGLAFIVVGLPILLVLILTEGVRKDFVSQSYGLNLFVPLIIGLLLIVIAILFRSKQAIEYFSG